MPDLVVTVRESFSYAGKTGLAAWIAEGDLPGEAWSGNDSYFHLGGAAPNIKPGDRVYIVCEGKLRGYAPLVRFERWPESDGGGYALVRRGGAVAVTIDRPITGFRGFRYRDWAREEEKPFPDWEKP